MEVDMSLFPVERQGAIRLNNLKRWQRSTSLIAVDKNTRNFNVELQVPETCNSLLQHVPQLMRGTHELFTNTC